MKLRVALQPETLPAVSCERACQLYVPSDNDAGAHVADEPLETDEELPLVIRPEHCTPTPADDVQIRNWTVPASPAVGSENVAPKDGIVFMSAAFAGVLSTGVDGTVVSIVHDELAAAPTLPTVSVARTWNVWLPSARPE